jgi:threonine dehydrogenase-like Zn-dependent dehydrogenase
VIAHDDPVLAMMQSGRLDPTPLVSRHMKLDEAPQAYEAYANREALKIVMAP